MELFDTAQDRQNPENSNESASPKSTNTHDLPTPVYDRILADARKTAGEHGRLSCIDDLYYLPEDFAADELYCYLNELITDVIFWDMLAVTRMEKRPTDRTSTKGNPIHRKQPVTYWFSRPVSDELHIRWIHAERDKADANRRETSPPPMVDPDYANP